MGKRDSIDTFLKDVKEISNKHNMCISHEDYAGSFIVTRFNNDDIEWLMEAQDNVQDTGGV